MEKRFKINKSMQVKNAMDMKVSKQELIVHFLDHTDMNIEIIMKEMVKYYIAHYGTRFFENYVSDGDVQIALYEKLSDAVFEVIRDQMEQFYDLDEVVGPYTACSDIKAIRRLLVTSKMNNLS